MFSDRNCQVTNPQTSAQAVANSPPGIAGSDIVLKFGDFACTGTPSDNGGVITSCVITSIIFPTATTAQITATVPAIGAAADSLVKVKLGSRAEIR